MAAANRTLLAPGFIILTIAFIILLLISISLPTLKWAYFLHSNTATDVRYGIWSVCRGSQGNWVCSPRHLGYRLGSSAAQYVHTGPSKGMVLTPIAAFFTFIAWLFALSSNLLLLLISSISCFLAAAFVGIVFIIDLAIFIPGRHRLRENGASEASLGPALWLTLVSFILLLLAGCTVCFGRHRHQRVATNNTGGGFFGRRRGANNVVV